MPQTTIFGCEPHRLKPQCVILFMHSYLLPDSYLRWDGVVSVRCAVCEGMHTEQTLYSQVCLCIPLLASLGVCTLACLTTCEDPRFIALHMCATVSEVSQVREKEWMQTPRAKQPGLQGMPCSPHKNFTR